MKNVYNLVEGMVLYCENGETVVLDRFTDNQIWVKYRGKIHERPITILNVKLFFEVPFRKEPECLGKCEKVHNKDETNSVTIEKKQRFETKNEEKRSCMDCKFQVSGECSSWDLCDDFQPVYKISKSEMSYWPKEGDATRFKRKGHNK